MSRTTAGSTSYQLVDNELANYSYQLVTKGVQQVLSLDILDNFLHFVHQ